MGHLCEIQGKSIPGGVNSKHKASFVCLRNKKDYVAGVSRMAFLYVRPGCIEPHK